MNWYRTHHGMWSDPKLALVARRAGSSLPMAIAVWTALLDCASQARHRGSVDGFDAESVAFALGSEVEEVEALLSAMQAKGMTEGGRIARWEDRQYDKPSDAPTAVADRVARHRATKKAGDVTPCNATKRDVTPCNAIEEKRGEESIAEDSLLQPFTSSGGLGDEDAPPDGHEPIAVAPGDRRRESERSPARVPRGCRLPEGWQPDADALRWAEHMHPEIDLTDATARFGDYWRAQPGSRGVKADWAGTWRNWIRSSSERGQSLKRQTAPPGRASPSLPPVVPAGTRTRLSKAEEIDAINDRAVAAATRHGIVRPTTPNAGDRP